VLRRANPSLALPAVPSLSFPRRTWASLSQKRRAKPAMPNRV
jgi:hypothetical protein